MAACAAASVVAIGTTSAQQIVPAPAPVVERVAVEHRIRMGYRADARPFGYMDQSGKPSGYSIELCGMVAEALKAELGLGTLTIDWVPVAAANRFHAVSSGAVDMLCGADTVTLERRGEVAFSIPIFPGGIGVLMRGDAPANLREVLSGEGPTSRPTWRASASRVLQAKAFAAVTGTTAAQWLTTRIKDLQVLTVAWPVASYDAGVEAVMGRRVDALFGERAILLDLAQRHQPAGGLIVLDRLFTNEPLALALPLGDERLRLLVDRTLTTFYSSGALTTLYTKYFGMPDESAIAFFRSNTLPD
jgi:polar amino acid transport system substrate-binding protein